MACWQDMPQPLSPNHQGLNVALFWERVDFKEYLPMVPTSAITGDGMGDLIALVVSYSQKMLTQQLMLSQELDALVLEVRSCDCHMTCGWSCEHHFDCSTPLCPAGQGDCWPGYDSGRDPEEWHAV